MNAFTNSIRLAWETAASTDKRRALWATARRMATTEWKLLLLIVLVALALWGFAELADEVSEGETMSIDERIVLMMRQDADPSKPIGPGWLATAGRDVTALGDAVILVFIIFAVAGFLALEKKYGPAVFIIAVTVTGQFASSGLKLLFARERPDVVPHLTEVATASFPSGHSTMAAVVYLTLGMLLAQLQFQRRTKLFTLGLAVFLTVVVGLSRVYLGVHYPTDVLAGWLVGGCWAMLSALGYGIWRRRRELGLTRRSADGDDHHAAGSASAGSASTDRSDRPQPATASDAKSARST